MPENLGPTFTRADYNNLELVRQIVFHRLRADPQWNQLGDQWSNDAIHRFVRIEEPRDRQHFILLVHELFWQLVIHGVLTPGLNAQNLNLPFFRVTEYGRQVLVANRFLPHDPTGYLDDVRAVATTTLTEVAVGYLEEALRCFNAGCHSAATLLIGVATEAVFLRLCDVIVPTLRNPRDKSAFAALRDNIKQKHRWIVDRYQGLPGPVRRSQLPESLDMTLTGLYEMIRRQRNELGHPQDRPPVISREQAFVFFRLLPTYLADVEAFAAHCTANGW